MECKRSQEAAYLKELAQAADRPGMGQQMQQIAEGYEAACQTALRAIRATHYGGTHGGLSERECQEVHDQLVKQLEGPG